MLVIRGDPRVADIFFGEFMRLFNHFQIRNVLNQLSDADEVARLPLTPDASWTAPAFARGGLPSTTSAGCSLDRRHDDHRRRAPSARVST